MINLINHHYNYAKGENKYALFKRRKGYITYPFQYLEELSGLSELVAFSNILNV